MSKEIIEIGIKDLLYSNPQYIMTFPLFFLVFIGLFVLIIGLFFLIKFIIDSYIKEKIEEHKKGCKKK